MTPRRTPPSRGTSDPTAPQPPTPDPAPGPAEPADTTQAGRDPEGTPRPAPRKPARRTRKAADGGAGASAPAAAPPATPAGETKPRSGRTRKGSGTTAAGQTALPEAEAAPAEPAGQGAKRAGEAVTAQAADAGQGHGPVAARRTVSDPADAPDVAPGAGRTSRRTRKRSGAAVDAQDGARDATASASSTVPGPADEAVVPPAAPEEHALGAGAGRAAEVPTQAQPAAEETAALAASAGTGPARKATRPAPARPAETGVGAGSATGTTARTEAGAARAATSTASGGAPSAPAATPPASGGGSVPGGTGGTGRTGRTGGGRKPAAAPRPRGLRAAGPLSHEDRGRLLGGSHHDPHGLLGAHLVRGGVQIRVLRPYATGVTILAKGLRTELNAEGDGLFSGVLPLRAVPEYRLLVAYPDHPDGFETEDPYRFLPALGDLDLHLIGEGRHEELWRALGSHPMTHQGVTGTRFTVWAPDARGVRVVGDFNYWDGTGFPMRSLGATGVWELFVPGVGDGALYKFEIARPDGSHTVRADPMARRTEVPPANASVVTVSHHEWRDQDWMARRAERPVHEAPFSVYEVHLPSWRPGLTYRQLAEQLPRYVSDLGFTHVEFMPVAEHPFGGSWGYQVTGFYAPTSRMGTPDDFRHLVDSLHRAGIGVLVDWVPAHFPRDDWALAEFDGRPLYEHADPQRAAHPDWGTLEFDYGRKEVRNFLVANATYWCEEFHIDGLRVDAVASMLYLDYSREDGQWSPNEFGGRENLDAVSFLQEMNATVYRRNPGVVTIAEESTAWDGVTRATHHGGLGFGLKWNMGWMHDSLGYVEHEPVHRRFHHNEMTFSMVYAYSENYVLPISHDEVVHGKRALVSKMPGDWWQQRANHRAYLGFMWAHPGKQLLFMGQEFAQGAEWSEGHGPDWWLLDPSYAAEPDHRGVRDLVRELNTVYGATPALWEQDTVPDGFAWVDGGAAEDNVFSFLRFDRAGAPLLAVTNFSPVVRHDYRLGVPPSVPVWTEVLNTDEERFGGSGVLNADPVKAEPVEAHGRRTSVALTLPPLATVWLRPA